ncbi:4a-hydroxytetrahydrobiopterin dehydratase [Mycolicibacterium cosmeticum]|uniref:Lactoylglutathione lyase family protein n=1 Tax=Mycolicibacterium cosmeticum TaxID=258533 RepID=W9B6Z9_MYCCO|nr:VOC family protein [Mycolicibacterium cosmeticum]TLH81179.1 4a-hydroxytetrahydrobiopterin dehydratase [Mycolicibacterium cosmeticum]CDO10762.1 lactoylglutathione lyase family protein [Mycolicibacterium cosmeticum]
MTDETLPTRRQISDAVAAAGWRLVLGALYTEVRVPSLAEAAAVAASAARAAGAAEPQHLGIDLRADRAVLRLRSPQGVNRADIAAAHAITTALAADGHATTAGAVSVQALEIAIDALDIPAVRPFWKAVTGYVDETGASDLTAGLVDPTGRGPAIWFQQMDAPRAQRNRIHLDVDVPHDEAPARLEAALAAGGRLLSDRRAPAFWVLADAEGNEACVCTWQGRD